MSRTLCSLNFLIAQPNTMCVSSSVLKRYFPCFTINSSSTRPQSINKVPLNPLIFFEQPQNDAWLAGLDRPRIKNFIFKLKNIHLTCGYITRAFLYDQLFALLFIKHKRKQTILDKRSRFARSTIPQDKWETTCSLQAR